MSRSRIESTKSRRPAAAKEKASVTSAPVVDNQHAEEQPRVCFVVRWRGGAIASRSSKLEGYRNGGAVQCLEVGLSSKQE
jgi:hypothetical protein